MTHLVWSGAAHLQGRLVETYNLPRELGHGSSWVSPLTSSVDVGLKKRDQGRDRHRAQLTDLK